MIPVSSIFQNFLDYSIVFCLSSHAVSRPVVVREFYQWRHSFHHHLIFIHVIRAESQDMHVFWVLSQGSLSLNLQNSYLTLTMCVDDWWITVLLIDGVDCTIHSIGQEVGHVWWSRNCPFHLEMSLVSTSSSVTCFVQACRYNVYSPYLQM